MAPEGTLLVRRVVDGAAAVRQERLRFSDLQQLLDLCATEGAEAAFVQVEVVGSSAGRQRRLVLDFGRFGAR